MRKDGKTLEPLMKSLPAPFSLAYKKRVFSPNRIKYPLKRVDWEPRGERNTENRGKSKFVRISWDKAAEIISDEIKRIQNKYGPYAILAQADGHGENKTIHSAHGQQTMLLDKMGSFTKLASSSFYHSSKTSTIQQLPQLCRTKQNKHLFYPMFRKHKGGMLHAQLRIRLLMGGANTNVHLILH